MRADATIFKRLPVVIEYYLEEAQPDVGIMLSGAEIHDIYTCRIRNGKETLRPIPPSWWHRLIKSRKLAQLEETLSEEAYY